MEHHLGVLPVPERPQCFCGPQYPDMEEAKSGNESDPGQRIKHSPVRCILSARVWLNSLTMLHPVCSRMVEQSNHVCSRMVEQSTIAVLNTPECVFPSTACLGVLLNILCLASKGQAYADR